VRVAREAVGNDVDIGLDYHGRELSPAVAIQLAREIEQYNPLFLEEPALSDLVAPHHACSPVSLLANVHIDTVIPSFLIQECYVDLSSDFVRRVFIDPPPIENGSIAIPQKAGLGIDFEVAPGMDSFDSPVSGSTMSDDGVAAAEGVETDMKGSEGRGRPS
jgi:L-alanine-DL-glutamate epimerase-like enolase superfamily enzyme